MLVFLFLAFSLALCQSESLGKLVDDLPSEGQVERVDQDQMEERRHSWKPKQCYRQGFWCRYHGGYCYPSDKTAACDYNYNYLCPGRNCQCCFNCNTIRWNSQCKQGGGTCRKTNKCMPTEYQDVLASCVYRQCGCCRECMASAGCSGTCVGNVEYYLEQNDGYFVDEEGSCDQSGCTCIQKCPEVDSMCFNVTGNYCVPNNSTCMPGEILSATFCNNSTTCGCCVPDCNVTNENSTCQQVNGTCRTVDECFPFEYPDVNDLCGSTTCTCCHECMVSLRCSGACVGNVEYYLDVNDGFYVDEEGCCGGQSGCTCIQKCPGVNSMCYNETGNSCVPDNSTCMPGEILSATFCSNSTTCGCCVPDELPVLLSRHCPSVQSLSLCPVTVSLSSHCPPVQSLSLCPVTTPPVYLSSLCACACACACSAA